MDKDFFHNFVSTNVVLYRLYHFMIRSRRGGEIKLPSRKDDLYVDGFPRSGNTFFVGLINHIFKNELQCNSHHLHKVAGIKMGLRCKLKTFILIREPSESIASFLIMQDFYKKGNVNDLNYMNTLLRQYIIYYEFVKKNKSDIELVFFEKLIDSPFSYLVYLNKLFGLNHDNEELLQKYEEFNVYFKNKQLKKPSQRTSLPNEERNLIKSKIKIKLRESKYLTEAENIYNNLFDDLKK